MRAVRAHLLAVLVEFGDAVEGDADVHLRRVRTSDGEGGSALGAEEVDDDARVDPVALGEAVLGGLLRRRLGTGRDGRARGRARGRERLAVVELVVGIVRVVLEGIVVRVRASAEGERRDHQRRGEKHEGQSECGSTRARRGDFATGARGEHRCRGAARGRRRRRDVIAMRACGRVARTARPRGAWYFKATTPPFSRPARTSCRINDDSCALRRFSHSRYSCTASATPLIHAAAAVAPGSATLRKTFSGT